MWPFAPFERWQLNERKKSQKSRSIKHGPPTRCVEERQETAIRKRPVHLPTYVCWSFVSQNHYNSSPLSNDACLTDSPFRMAQDLASISFRTVTLYSITPSNTSFPSILSSTHTYSRTDGSSVRHTSRVRLAEIQTVPFHNRSPGLRQEPRVICYHGAVQRVRAKEAVCAKDCRERSAW